MDTSSTQPAATKQLDTARTEIELLGLDDLGVEGRKGFGRTAPDVLAGRVRLDRLADNLSDFCRQAGQMFASASAATSGLHLESMEVSLALTAKGEVRLVGAVSGEVSGGITLVFKRRTQE
ncbi:Pepco domain-containing protein [Streptomyces collinus]|uniref:Pepco domain-containing protein n=1 Tax=Streptomyces collinus TaxID=42684 RepID=UPI0036759F55